jgi:hypothetical protein
VRELYGAEADHSPTTSAQKISRESSNKLTLRLKLGCSFTASLASVKSCGSSPSI